MSVSKWAYEPKKCDGGFCCGECDNCSIQLRHKMNWTLLMLMISMTVRTTVDRLNELQESRSIKQERSLFE